MAVSFQGNLIRDYASPFVFGKIVFNTCYRGLPTIGGNRAWVQGMKAWVNARGRILGADSFLRTIPDTAIGMGITKVRTFPLLHLQSNDCRYAGQVCPRTDCDTWDRGLR
jgi:hypothetical protein